MFVRANGSGGSDNYAATDYQAVAASGIPTFTTLGKAKAVWIEAINRTNGNQNTCTNVDPTTGEIVTNGTYQRTLSTGSAPTAWVFTTQRLLIITDNSVTLSLTLMGANYYSFMYYTY